jgi:acyl-CoA thioesterase-1
MLSFASGMVQRRHSCAESVFNRIAHFFALVVGVLFLIGAGAAQSDDKLILALGDSLTAGFGLAKSSGFVAQLEAKLGQSGIGARVIDGGVSGDTSAGGLARLDWLLVDQPDLVIVELGANDGLRGLDPSATMANLDAILMRLKARGAKVLLTGMQAPPNMGQEYAHEFNGIYETVARKHNTALYPFFLEGVAAKPHLNQSDGIHPNAEGVELIVEQILPLVLTMLAVDAG